ncbi:non-homologous end-joining DNA ligase [Fodinicola acaciae]|uniref:non-homologous end-joining DNA ligase n=1 Tax=Fodinicola acaciae TaxID=2681555 RepID=UPI0013D7BDF2|nr:non-homologous end-joining DNA ligase [Fodinicola acaciae]
MARRQADPRGIPDAVEPMLATPATAELKQAMPASARWSYEFKSDGYRAIMRLSPTGEMALNSRNLNDFTAAYPELDGAVGPAYGGQTCVLDGEIVGLDANGRPDFMLLQNHGTGRTKVSYFVFDILRLGDRSLLDQPYAERRKLLEKLEPANPRRIAVPPSYDHAALSDAGLTPQGLLDVAREQRLEGVVGKISDSAYVPGRRSKEWLKFPLTQTQEVIVGGWRSGQGRRAGTIGALLLGAHHPDTGDLLYVGDVGTGFSDRVLLELQGKLEAISRRTAPFANEVPRDRAKDARWVRPSIVGEVEYRQFTSDGRLRHTAWRGLRPDRRPSEVTAPIS